MNSTNDTFYRVIWLFFAEKRETELAAWKMAKCAIANGVENHQFKSWVLQTICATKFGGSRLAFDACQTGLFGTFIIRPWLLNATAQLFYQQFQASRWLIVQNVECWICFLKMNTQTNGTNKKLLSHLRPFNNGPWNAFDKKNCWSLIFSRKSDVENAFGLHMKCLFSPRSSHNGILKGLADEAMWVFKMLTTYRSHPSLAHIHRSKGIASFSLRWFMLDCPFHC